MKRFLPAYTLVELLIIVTISGLLLSVGAGAYGAAARRQAVKAASETLLSTLQAAQKNSSIGNTDCGAAFTGIQVAYSAGGSSLSVTALCNSGPSGAVRTINLDKITLVNSGTLLFRPLGQGVIVGAGGESYLDFQHVDTPTTYRLVINKSGTISYLGEQP